MPSASVSSAHLAPRPLVPFGHGCSAARLVCTLLVALFGTGLPATPVQAQDSEIPTVEEHTEGMTPMEGLFDLYWDEGTGSLFWEITGLAEDFLYQVSMGSGLGSNPVGIDRGQLRGTWVLRPEIIGPRLLLMEPNYRFVANSDNATEVEAVRDAFAPSVHWGFDIAARTGDRILVDATDFFLRDARGIVQQLQRTGQGSYRLDRSRSAIYMPATKSLPANTEVEAMLTFTTDQPGRLVNAVAASGEAVTLRVHHSLIRLPGPGFETRIADPRIGVNGPDLLDYATAIDEDMRVRLAARHRLQRRDPTGERSEAVEPIVYYVDPGTPEPVRSALVEGAEWWNDAFEAAGYIDAFQVRILPDSVDPQDIRYHMIHWTHRRTRGYSYGNSIIDPRTGEIIRGVVNLGSLRLRQDYLLGQGMVPPFPGGISSAEGAGYFGDAPGMLGQAPLSTRSVGSWGDGYTQGVWGSWDLSPAPEFEYLSQVAPNSDAVEMALARVRQLSAHEVGHTLGLPHNYIASAQGRESVMDYPAPLVEITSDGRLDLSNAYLRRIGEYDKVSINWLYRDFPDGSDVQAGLDAIVQDALSRDIRYVGHTNNNFIGAGHQYAGVWDNGSNLIDHLEVELRVREIGLERFGLDVLKPGEPLSNLEYVLLPLYMHHRFQLRSAVESLGGADYRPAVKGDGQVPITIIPGAEQRRALAVVLRTLEPDFLALPERIVEMIPPTADRYDRGEAFPGNTERLFDPLGAAEAAASFTVGEIFQPQRMARLENYGSMGDYPDLSEVVDRVVEATWEADVPGDEYRRAVQRIVQRSVVDRMIQQASMEGNPAQVRAVLADRLDRLATRIEASADASSHARLVAGDVRRWQARTDGLIPGPALQMPAGDPIGGSSRGGSPR